MKIITNESPYNLDTDENGFPTFTEKNIAFMNGILKYDSNYSAYSDHDTDEYLNSYAGILEKGNFFDFKASESTGETDELGNPIDDLYRVIVSIDKINSTHLASEGRRQSGEKGNKGRAKVAARIRAMGGQQLKEKLACGDPELVSTIADPEVGGKHNFSFATKFCAFVSIHALHKDNYCIYDEILQSVLPYYAYMYIDDCRNYDPALWKTVRATKANQFRIRNVSLVWTFKDQKNYDGYRELIDRIIEGIAAKCGVRISYSDFDHLVWYYFKSSQSKVHSAMNILPNK